MTPRPNARIRFLCSDHVVCSIDEDHAVSIPLAHFDFPPFPGQEIFLNEHRDKPYACVRDENEPLNRPTGR